jgi:catechol 2,3-dioxygenase-like lactoylglutathione lyase family enzyme
MIDHLSVPVSAFATSKTFYSQALAPLGYAPLMQFDDSVGFGAGEKPDFWIVANQGPVTAIHVALVATARKDVDAFYKAALAAGARDNGAPGLRAHYHPTYYGAFVLDPDGHNIEAVCHKPE